MELTIKNVTYPLKASFGFLDTIEKKDRRSVSGETVDVGLASAITMMNEAGDMRCLADLLLALNTGMKPKLERAVLEEWLADECEDIEGLCAEVMDFLSRANVCRVRLKKLGLLTQIPKA